MTWVYAITITTNLKEAASEWLMSLHDEDASELIDAFMQPLQECFKDPLIALCAKTRIRDLKQGKEPVTEYLQDFC